MHRTRRTGTPRTPANGRLLLGLVLGIAAASWLLPRHVPLFQAAELWLEDLRVGTWSIPEPQSDAVVILGITENSLEELPYRNPLDRGLLADLIESLDRKGVRAIGLDLLFDQATELAKDERLIEVLASARAPVTIAWVDPIHEEALMTEQQRSYFASFRKRCGARVGLANFRDRDLTGAIRRITVGMRPEDGGLAGFAVAVAASVGAPYTLSSRSISYRMSPVPDAEPFAIYEVRPNLVSVLPPRKWVEGKVVLIGAVRPYEDRHLTPLAAVRSEQAGTLPGVVIHAHVLDQILEGRELRKASALLELLIALLMSALGLGLVRIEASSVSKSVVGAALLVGYGWVGRFWFTHGGPLLPVLMPGLGFVTSIGVFAGVLGRHYRAQQRFLRKAFSRYISPELVSDLQRDPSRLRLGGEKRELSFIFTDVVGFTTLSENMAAEDLSALMNTYLDGMVRVLFECGGTLDKFVGDAIVCIFGAPVEQPDHARRAVDCALAMDAFAQRFASEQAEQGIAFGSTRIGVHTGVASVGNFGADVRFNYTAFGDVVNTAARLESANKHLGTRICVSEVTAQQCLEREFRPVAELVLKGRLSGLQVFEPVVEGGRDSVGSRSYLEAYTLMEKGESEQALCTFRELGREFPHDPLVALHLKRLESGADGSLIVMESK